MYNRRQIFAWASAALHLPAWTQTKTGWPKTIRMVVPFAAGGLADVMARIYAEHMARALGVVVVIDNRPGAGGLLGVQSVIKSPNDGSTWLFTTTGTVWQNRILYRNISFDAERDLSPVAIIPAGPLVLATSEQVPVKTLIEFVTWAKDRKTSMGSFAPGSIVHMMGEALNRRYGLDLAIANYKGETPMWSDLGSANISMAGGSVTGFTAISAARNVRPIATNGVRRSAKFSEVPTLLEQGFQDPVFKLTGGGFTMCAPAGTPVVILDEVARCISEAESSTRMRALQNTLGVVGLATVGRREAAELWKIEAPQWIAAAQQSGISLD